MKKQYTIDSEKLAYWYFRINGFLTIENFVVHPNTGSEQRTDVDVLAVRFPYRKELPDIEKPMKDDERLILDPDKIQLMLVEVKASECRLNDTWKKTDKRNMQKIILAIGLFKSEEVETVSKNLYDKGYFKDDSFLVSFCCLGKTQSLSIREKYRDVPQITWEEVLRFIYERFYNYQVPKSDHPQWDENGRILWKAVEQCTDFDDFLESINIS